MWTAATSILCERDFTMNIAVCDDNNQITEQLKAMIEGFEDIPSSVCPFSNGEQLLGSVNSFDVIFLDIDMPGISGIETARRIRQYDKQVKIIFLTSYSEYVGSAFGVHAFSYLLKPVKKDVIHRQLLEAAEYAQQEKTPAATMDFSTLEGVVRLRLDEILYFEYFGREIRIMTTGRAIYHMKGRITQLGGEMEPFGFAMPHKSFVVNLFHVKSVKGYEIRMMNEELLPLSQKKSTAFRQTLHEYLSSRIGGAT